MQQSASTAYIVRLVQRASQTLEISAAYVLGGHGESPFEPGAEVGLWFIVPPGWAEGLEEWLRPLGEVCWWGREGERAMIIPPDGSVLTLTLAAEASSVPPGAQAVFERGRPAAPPAPQEDPGRALQREAGQFWAWLTLALGAIGRQEVFAAHGRLERCRALLACLYRRALGRGYAGGAYDGLDGEELAGLSDWLVAPLDYRAQWRCAARLAATYESLFLPLAERLSLEYPWAVRNLAFARLDEVRPDRGPSGEAPLPKPPAAEPAARPAGPARFKIKRRTHEGE